MNQKTKIVSEMGLKSLVDAAALQALREHGGAFGIIFIDGKFHVVFGDSVRQIVPAGLDGNRLRQALIAALSDKDDDDYGFSL